MAKKYEEALLKEINEDRGCIGLKPVEAAEKIEIVHDEET